MLALHCFAYSKFFNVNIDLPKNPLRANLSSRGLFSANYDYFVKLNTV